MRSSRLKIQWMEGSCVKMASTVGRKGAEGQAFIKARWQCTRIDRQEFQGVRRREREGKRGKEREREEKGGKRAGRTPLRGASGANSVRAHDLVQGPASLANPRPGEEIRASTLPGRIGSTSQPRRNFFQAPWPLV
jgi:hypothetical protein